MIPIQLSIEGLYSYQKRQLIDFTNLADAGLFGIFGATGSGKSSILEAISYALYGETERMNAREGRNYNMMNLKSDRAYIEFDFRNHENRIFRACRELKRNSRRFDDVRPPKVTFYEQLDGQWKPLNHANAEKIIGLSYNNFKRTIIIPQGRFREFLELGPTARTDMMKEIFQLQRYDLQHSVRKLEGKNKTLLDQTEGQLKAYEAVSEEEIKTQKAELEVQEKNFIQIEKQHQNIDARFQRLKLLKIDYENLLKKEDERVKMGKQEQEILEAKARMEKYERISDSFRKLLEELEKQQTKAETLRGVRYQIEKELEGTDQELIKRNKEQDSLKSWYESLSEKQTEENDLFYIARMKESADEIVKFRKRVVKGEKLVEDTLGEVEKGQTEIHSAEKNIEKMKSEAVDPGLLVEVAKWFSDQENLLKIRADRNQNVTNFQKKIAELQKELIKRKVNPESYEADFEVFEDSLEVKIKELEDQRSEIEVRQRLAQYSHELVEGKPCLLCGSTAHPNVPVAEDVSEELKVILAKIQGLKEEVISLRQERTEVKEILSRMQFFEDQMKVGKADSEAAKKRLDEHQARFVWEEFDPEDLIGFQATLKEAKDLNQQLEEAEKKLSVKRKQLEVKQKKLDDYRKLLQEIQFKLNHEKSGYDRDSSNLKILKFENYQYQTVTEIHSLLNILKKKNQEVKSRYEILNKEILEFAQKKSSLEARRNATEVQLKELEKETSILQNQIVENLRKEKIENLAAVRAILEMDLDLKKERERIEKFRIEFQVLKNEINTLRKKLKSAAFDVEQFSMEEENWRSSEKRLKEVNEKMVGLRGELLRLEKSYGEKLELLEEWNQLSRRAENLRVMAGLFKASGFVQYVSTIYLSQLCDHANIRFQRMTRNQLRLQLGENNDFEIIDYLNEGRSRSVKTLSGGQSFQVSLSLALALAESVQVNARAEKNFFFIDEGFGTQDSQSVNIIFETLINLNKEDKIVGIISHVEELKERIPVSLTVINDPKKGSLILDS